MDVPDSLLCVFSAEIEATGESYRIEVPARELDLNDVEPGERYRIAMLESDSASTSRNPETQTEQNPPIAEGDRARPR